jgi:hypothetical protein
MLLIEAARDNYYDKESHMAWITVFGLGRREFAG